jgi:hypothetical protein
MPELLGREDGSDAQTRISFERSYERPVWRMLPKLRAATVFIPHLSSGSCVCGPAPFCDEGILIESARLPWGFAKGDLDERTPLGRRAA